VRPRLLSLTSSLVIALTLGAAAGQLAPALGQLQGRWVVTSGEHNGKPLDAIKGGVMTVTADSFEIRTASGNMLKGTLRVDTSRRPFQMDLLHANGTKWEGIYSVEEDDFKLNYVEAGQKDRRPDAFTTSDRTEASMVRLRRSPK